MTESVVWYQRNITRTQHEELKRHRSFCLWFTGLSGAGKSTLANAVQKRLHDLGAHTYMLDGDNVRHGLNHDLGFSPEDRRENVRRVAEVAGLFVDAGVISIAALISPFEQDRLMARKVFSEGDFIEVFVDCPIDTCIERDPKGFYKKAQAGVIPEFTGITSPYETPSNPELTVNTVECTVVECVNRVVTFIESKLNLHEVTI